MRGIAIEILLMGSLLVTILARAGDLAWDLLQIVFVYSSVPFLINTFTPFENRR